MATVEILHFGDCPNYRRAIELVHLIAPDAQVRLTQVEPETVEAERFLGSPSIRVDGRDVEPGAAARAEHVYAGRVYRTPEGFGGLPDPLWIAEALG